MKGSMDKNVLVFKLVTEMKKRKHLAMALMGGGGGSLNPKVLFSLNIN